MESKGLFLLIYPSIYLGLGEKLWEEVSAAGEQHVPKPVFIESVGEAAVCLFFGEPNKHQNPVCFAVESK